MGWASARMTVILAVVAMVAAACGGSGEGATQTTVDSSQESTSGDGTSPAESTGGEGTSSAEPTEQDPDDQEAAAQGDESFCTDMNSSVVMATSVADDDLQGLYAKGIEELDDLRSRAPSDIAGDVQTLYEATVQLDGLLADYGYDVEAIPSEEQQQVLSETGVGAAMATISEYCGGSSSAGGAASLTGAGVGSFTVDGESFDNVDVYRCEPFSAGSQGPDPDDLDLVAGFLTGSSALQITVSRLNGDGLSMGAFYSREGADGLEQFDGAADNSIPGRFEAGPWHVRDLETGDEIELDAAPYVIEGDRITGALTGLTQSWPQDGDGTVDVTFDLEIPSEINDCSTR